MLAVKGIKIMLLGIAVMLAVLMFHLFIAARDVLVTDFIAILGLGAVVAGYFIGDSETK